MWLYEEAVSRAVSYVASQLDEALDLVRLARGAALSPFHFHRVFRGMVGETPLELHRGLRMERAAWRTPLVVAMTIAATHRLRYRPRRLRKSVPAAPSRAR